MRAWGDICEKASHVAPWLTVLYPPRQAPGCWDADAL